MGELSTALAGESLYPTSVVRRLLQSLPSPLQTTLLLTVLYLTEFGKTLIGRVGQKTTQVLWRLLAGERKEYIPDNSGAEEFLRTSRRRRYGPIGREAERSYDEVYESREETDEEIIVIPPPPPQQSVESSTALNTPDNSGETISRGSKAQTQEEHTTTKTATQINTKPAFTPKRPLPSLSHKIKTIPRVSTVRSEREHRKSKKGDALDVERLRRLGYNRYRFVSTSFIERNNLRPKQKITANEEGDYDDAENE